MRFICQIRESNGLWLAEHAGSDIGPIRVSAPTRDQAVDKMKAEIHYWLEMCPCSGQAYADVEVELVESA